MNHSRRRGRKRRPTSKTQGLKSKESDVRPIGACPSLRKRSALHRRTPAATEAPGTRVPRQTPARAGRTPGGKRCLPWKTTAATKDAPNVCRAWPGKGRRHVQGRQPTRALPCEVHFATPSFAAAPRCQRRSPEAGRRGYKGLELRLGPERPVGPFRPHYHVYLCVDVS